MWKTLRLVGQYADTCLLIMRAGEEMRSHKLDELRGRCADVGRAIEDIELTPLGTSHLALGEMSVEKVLDIYRNLSELSFHQAIFNMPSVCEITP